MWHVDCWGGKSTNDTWLNKQTSSCINNQVRKRIRTKQVCVCVCISLVYAKYAYTHDQPLMFLPYRLFGLSPSLPEWDWCVRHRGFLTRAAALALEHPGWQKIIDTERLPASVKQTLLFRKQMYIISPARTWRRRRRSCTSGNTILAIIYLPLK